MSEISTRYARYSNRIKSNFEIVIRIQVISNSNKNKNKNKSRIHKAGINQKGWKLSWKECLIRFCFKIADRNIDKFRGRDEGNAYGVSKESTCN